MVFLLVSVQEFTGQQQSETDFSMGTDEKYAFSGEEHHSEGEKHHSEGETQREQAENASADADATRTSNHSGGKSNIFERYKDPTKQFTGTRSYHQDHSSVGGLTAKDIDKARESKSSINKPHKQMVNKVPLIL